MGTHLFNQRMLKVLFLVSLVLQILALRTEYVNRQTLKLFYLIPILIVNVLSLFLYLERPVSINVRYPIDILTEEAVKSLYISSGLFVSAFTLWGKGNIRYVGAKIVNLRVSNGLALLISVTGVFLLLITAEKRFIWNTAYGIEGFSFTPVVDSVLLKILAITLLSIGVFKFSADTRGVSRRIGGVFLLVSTVLILFRGDRGGFLPIWSSYLYALHTRRIAVSRQLFLLSFTLAVVIFWSTFRSTWAFFGLARSVELGIDRLRDTFSFVANPDNFYFIPMIPQSIWHWLHCYDMHVSGQSLGLTYYFDFLGQMLPKFVADIIGYERPLNLAWRLAEYRRHGGGMFHLAGAYWTFGYVGVIFFAVLLRIFINFIERRLYSLRTPLYYVNGMTFLYTSFYGWQPFFKTCLILGIVNLIFNRIWKSESYL